MWAGKHGAARGRGAAAGCSICAGTGMRKDCLPPRRAPRPAFLPRARGPALPGAQVLSGFPPLLPPSCLEHVRQRSGEVGEDGVVRRQPDEAPLAAHRVQVVGVVGSAGQQLQARHRTDGRRGRGRRSGGSGGAPGVEGTRCRGARCVCIAKHALAQPSRPLLPWQPAGLTQRCEAVMGASRKLPACWDSSTMMRCQRMALQKGTGRGISTG